MILFEAALLTILLVILVTSSYTDCRTSQIKNRTLLLCAAAAAIVDVLYYCAWAGEFFVPFLSNLGLLSLLAVLFYSYHLWAAGDSKLLITVALCLPGRFLTFWDIGPFSGFFIVVVTFSVAFLYIIGETVFLGVKEKNLFQIYRQRFDIKQYVVSYLSMAAATTLISIILSRIFPQLYMRNTPLLMALNFLIVLSLIQVRSHFSMKVLLAATVIMWVVLIVLFALKIYPVSLSFNLRSLVYVLLIMLVWAFAEKYNYQTIPTSNIKAGQILSMATVMSFKPSRVQGLPTGTTEDLRSRLTDSEAESIRRWEKSALGKPYVVIVRKIPFAVFISIGTIAFLIVEVLMQW